MKKIDKMELLASVGGLFLLFLAIFGMILLFSIIPLLIVIYLLNFANFVEISVNISTYLALFGAIIFVAVDYWKN